MGNWREVESPPRKLHPAAEDCRGQPSEGSRRPAPTTSEKVIIFPFVNMSDISDSENISLSESVDAAGSAASTLSMGSSSAEEATGPRDRTPDHVSGISDIPSGSDPGTPTSRGQTGAARLEEILRASTSGRSGDVASDSTDPSGEEIHARQRPRSRGTRVNDMKVYRRADAEMVELAGDRPVYTADYYTSAVTLRYLAALRREFSILDDVDLVVPGPNDLPSRPPSGHIAFLNVSPAQLNANAYRVLVGCYVLWAAKFSETLPLFAFQNLYRMKTAPSSKGFYYFQGFKGTFITGCPDSDKQFKHLWFYAGGRWLHGHLSYFELPLSERVLVAFRRGYVWTRAPHAPAQTLAKIGELWELSDPERSQHRLLSEGSLKEYWVGSSSTSGRPDDQPRTAPPRVTIARMPEPAVHYRSRTSRHVVATVNVRSGVPREVPEVTVCGSSSGDPTSGAWGPRVADENLDLVIRELFLARGLRIEGRY
ncbi:hypothetical protein TIFTF001_037700 [Ficus carica]|uniref:Uncharacterized protein n=1 Tax=Ficus carica TaxID=3494 RepID=A0AA88J995_FICCA|nr:hypothetical protein TIFTF001_037700 [Ficus carica]